MDYPLLQTMKTRIEPVLRDRRVTLLGISRRFDPAPGLLSGH